MLNKLFQEKKKKKLLLNLLFGRHSCIFLLYCFIIHINDESVLVCTQLTLSSTSRLVK